MSRAYCKLAALLIGVCLAQGMQTWCWFDRHAFGHGRGAKVTLRCCDRVDESSGSHILGRRFQFAALRIRWWGGSIPFSFCQ